MMAIDLRHHRQVGRGSHDRVVLARGKIGFEAFDRDERSLGAFPAQEAAIDVIHAEVAPSAVDGSKYG
jgi:hypothetical protein